MFGRWQLDIGVLADGAFRPCGDVERAVSAFRPLAFCTSWVGYLADGGTISVVE